MYDSTSNAFWFHNGTAWQEIAKGANEPGLEHNLLNLGNLIKGFYEKDIFRIYDYHPI